MKLNDREKKLIFIVVGVILIALSYFIGYRKISAANNKLDDKIEENRTLYNNLKAGRYGSTLYIWRNYIF